MDKNFAFEDEEEQRLFNELPKETQIYIYRNYLYREFLQSFRRFFSIRNPTCHHQPAFYTWDNQKYQNFMLCLLRCLEPRREERGVMLVKELDEFNEVYFFNRGIYEIGFEINHKCFFVLRYKNSNVIGAYGVTFNVRALFVYKTFSACEGFSIRKQNWINEILDQNETIMSVIKDSVKEDYETYVKRKLLSAKQ